MFYYNRTDPKWTPREIYPVMPYYKRFRKFKNAFSKKDLSEEIDERAENFGKI